MAVLIILACLVALGLLAAAVYKSVVVKPELGQNRLPGAGDEAVDPGREPVDIDVVEKVDGQRKSKDFYTILVVGTDVASNSTDTIMLVSYDVTNQSATVMSIPRDTLVNTFGTGRYTRINSVYAAYGRGQKGMDALTYEVSELVGFIPDYRMFIKWELVGLMVEAIGGVEFDVPYHMEYDDPAQDLHIYLEKGLQTLNGDQAMQLVRWRKNNAGVSSGGGTGSDINRLQVQQSFLKAVLKQILQIKNVTRIGELAKLLGENVEGDLTVSNLIWFATSAVMGGLDSDAVEFCTMPVKPEGVYVYPDQEPLLELINTKLNPYREDVTIKQLDLIYVDGNGNLRSTG
ncbi:MAG: LCP family protein [Oscillospiraceae bacterium]|nr:LCP family protein [Oscillospiraceae bacterium]